MPPEDDVLTLDTALSLMQTATDGAAPAAEDDDTPAQAQNTAEGNENEDADQGADEHADDGATEGDTDGEQETPSDEGETKDEGEDQGDNALPPIEAPASWKTEEKEVWQSLPRKAQEAIQRREQDNTSALRTLQNKSAEQQKTVDAEVGRLKGLASQVEHVLTEKVQELAAEFPEIKSEADVVALAERDPGRYAAFQAKLSALHAANERRASAAKELTKAAQNEQTEALAKAKDALLEAFPAWKDLDVAKRETTELQDYAISQGAPEAAARANVDPVIYKLAQKAMLYDRAQAAKAKAVQRTPPRVVKPGTQSGAPNKAAKEEARRAQYSKLEQSGDIEDAMGLLRT